MLAPTFREVLHLLAVRLVDGQVTWALTGSASFALQGMPLTPQDIDVQTDKAGAYEIEARLAEFVRRPVVFSRDRRIRSYFGGLLVRGIPVDIIGDLQKLLPDGGWTPPPDLADLRQFVLLEGVRIPVLPLAYELEAYTLMGRSERAAQIRAWLKEHPAGGSPRPTPP